MSDCIHHWIIEPPVSAVSEAQCKLCGDEKEFSNVFDLAKTPRTNPVTGATTMTEDIALLPKKPLHWWFNGRLNEN